MIYKLWAWLQLWLPFGLILHIYKNNKALPSNIKMRSGRNLKAIMVSTEYGVIFTEEKYVTNRLKNLLKKQKEISNINDVLIKEINELDFIQREYLMGNLEYSQGKKP